VNAITERFGSPNSKFFARAKLYQLKQRGTVTEYIRQYENLIAKIDDITQAEGMQTFIQGLQPRLQEHFAGNPDLRSNLPQVMRIAESLDSVHHHVYPTYNPTSTPANYAQSDQTFPQPMEIDALRAQLNAIRSTQRQTDVRNRACFICHKTGHRAKMCPEKPKQESRDSSGKA
jgi:hypothetical protein